MKHFFYGILFSFPATASFAQGNGAAHWADSVYNKLSNDERIAQLMVVRLSSMDPKTKAVTFYDQQAESLVKKYNIGGICLFQGGPAKQASIINQLQAVAKTPILMCIDAEWGVGMRLLDSVLPLPKQMMLGAMSYDSIVYAYGQIVARQCKRMGIQVNYAPVVDVNNNPNNPVINDRSFGENKYKVADFGIAYMKGMQAEGVMACAKHFPGHGDVSVDSHFDLPVIKKSMAQLDSLELYPFRKIFEAGIGSVMVAHLYIPSIDSSANRATSLSGKNINGLMRGNLGYNGLTFTDALEMQGVKKFFPDGAASVESLIAGNDMLCLPGDVPLSIKKIREAIKKKRLSWGDIELHCKKVLEAKYTYGLTSLQPVTTNNISADLNREVPAMRRLVAENAVTLALKKDSIFFPLRATGQNNIAVLTVGSDSENAFAGRLRKEHNATVFNFDRNAPYDGNLVKKLSRFKKVIIGVHGLGRSPSNNFGFSKDMVRLVNEVSKQNTSVVFLFGNPYAAKDICNVSNLIVCYEDDEIIQTTAIDLLQGKAVFKGKLPVTVCENLIAGRGIFPSVDTVIFLKAPAGAYLGELPAIDSIMADARQQQAVPGGVVLALQNNKVIYQKAFGYFTYDSSEPVALTSVYDLASVTKIAATTLSVMKLYDEGKFILKKKLSDYLPETRGTNKANITAEQLLIHESGLQAFIPFYRETLDPSGAPLTTIYTPSESDSSSTEVAKNLYIKNVWKDTMYARLLSSTVVSPGKYLYSDNDFIFLQKIVERLSGRSIDSFTNENFYAPMHLNSIGFNPLERNSLSAIAPEEKEKNFRFGVVRGYVHDPGAAMFGGVSGHAGLFSNAGDLAAVMQMLLDSGTFGGKKYLSKTTIDFFTAYSSPKTRRGLGFDKPEKDNDIRKEPYPSVFASAHAFGHTGFTGTCAWADPAQNLVFVFLGNRIYPEVTNLFGRMNIRGKIMDEIYHALASRKQSG